MQRIEVHNEFEIDRLEDVQIYAPEIKRISAEAGSHPSDLNPFKVVFGAESRHLVIHDVYAASWWSDIDGGLLYDVTVYNVGWQSADPTDSRTQSDTGHGWTIYTQNGAENKPKVIDTCVLIAAFEGGKILATNTDKVHHYRVSRSIMVGKQFLIGGQTYGADDIVIDECSFLDCQLQLGYVAPNGEATVRNCMFGLADSPCVLVGNQNQKSRDSSWRQFTFTGNTLVAGDARIVRVNNTSLEDMKAWEWDYNTYYSTSAQPFAIWQSSAKANGTLVNDGLLSFEEWKAATGFDQHSTFIHGEPPPLMRVYPVPEKNAANIAVINAPNHPTLPLPENIVGGLIRDGRNYDAPYSGAELIMSGEVKPPLNWAGSATEIPLWRATFPRYGVFRVENKPEAPPTDSAAAANDAQTSDLQSALAKADVTLADLREKVARGYMLAATLHEALKDFEGIT